MKLYFNFIILMASTICIGVESISNGTFVTIKDAPYYVSLTFFSSVFCGGTLISEYWIVSAAHCFDTFGRLRTYIRIGSGVDKDPANKHAIDKVIIAGDYMQNFGRTTGSHDISLIKLKKPIIFNEFQQPIKISRDLPKAEDKIIIHGIGGQRPTRTDPLSLKAIELKVINQEECRSIWDPDYYVTNDVFCAGDGVSGPCSGDSGGPVVMDGKLIGIVRWGSICSASNVGRPSVYTRIDKYYDWIIKHTGITY